MDSEPQNRLVYVAVDPVGRLVVVSVGKISTVREVDSSQVGRQAVEIDRGWDCD